MSDVSSAVNEAVAEAYLNAESIFVGTLEIMHASFEEPFYVVNNNENLILKIEDDAQYHRGKAVEFIRLGFEIKLPSIDTNKLPELTVKVDNIYLKEEDKRISDYIALTKGSLDPVYVTYRSYDVTALVDSASRESVPIPEPSGDAFTLILSTVDYNIHTITAKASFFNPANETFPKNVFTLEEFPALANN